MKSDCAFIKGHKHRVCQDYAVAGSGAGEMHYVIVADGCSSSPDTDIGARLLAKSAENFIQALDVTEKTPASAEPYYRQSINMAGAAAQMLHLDPCCLDATLLTIKAQGDRFTVSCYGDGIVALARKDGKIEVHSIEFPGGYPNYASYLLDIRDVRLRRTEEMQKEIKHLLFPAVDDVPVQIEPSQRAFELFPRARKNYLYAAVFSDGAHSLVEVDDQITAVKSRIVSITEIIPMMLAFRPTAQGTPKDFVQQRMQAFVKMCETRNWMFGDDLSMGAIYLGY